MIYILKVMKSITKKHQIRSRMKENNKEGKKIPTDLASKSTLPRDVVSPSVISHFQHFTVILQGRSATWNPIHMVIYGIYSS